MQFWPPDDEHMCSKHVEAWNKLICKTKILCIKLVNYWDKYTENISVATTKLNRTVVKYWGFIAETIIVHFDARHYKFLTTKRGKECVSLQFHLIAYIFVTSDTNSLQATQFNPRVRWLILLSSAVFGVSVSDSIGSVSLTHSVRRNDAASLTICSSLPSRESWRISLMAVVYNSFIHCRCSNFYSNLRILGFFWSETLLLRCIRKIAKSDY